MDSIVDIVDKAKRSEVMRSVKSRDTKPELLVRRMLHKAGFRYRLHAKNLPGKPDIVFPSKHKAILVHGCFWHQHRGCHLADRPTSNTEYWNPKLDGNMARDARNLEALRKSGWEVLIIWDCQTRDKDALLKGLVKFLRKPRRK